MLEGSIDINLKGMGEGMLGGFDKSIFRPIMNLERTPDLIAKAMERAQKEIQSDFFKQLVKEQKEAMAPKEGGMTKAIGGITGIAPQMLKLVGIAGGILGAIGLMVKSSGILQGVLGGISKLIMLIVRPLGDIFGVALMPILYILKPIGLFFNMIMRPYIQKAMAAMKAGGALLAAGKPMEAMGAFVLGAEYLLKPMFDISIKAGEVILAGFADLLSNVPIVGVAFKGMGDIIRSSSQGFINTTTNILDVQLGSLLASTEMATGKSMFNIVKGLNDMEVASSFAMGLISSSASIMSTTIVDDLSKLNQWVDAQWGPSFSTYVKNAMEAALRQQIYIPQYTTSTVQFSGGGRGFVETTLNLNDYLQSRGIDPYRGTYP